MIEDFDVLDYVVYNDLSVLSAIKILKLIQDRDDIEGVSLKIKKKEEKN